MFLKLICLFLKFTFLYGDKIFIFLQFFLCEELLLVQCLKDKKNEKRITLEIKQKALIQFQILSLIKYKRISIVLYLWGKKEGEKENIYLYFIWAKSMTGRKTPETTETGYWSMNQGKLEVVKQEMAKGDIDILGINELKWTGMDKFNSDDHYIYYCGQESLRRNGVALTVNKRV